MLNVIGELYFSLINPQFIQVKILADGRFQVLLIADCFTDMSQDERLDMLAEILQAVYPDYLKEFRFHFVAFTSLEVKRPTLTLVR